MEVWINRFILWYCDGPGNNWSYITLMIQENCHLSVKFQRRDKQLRCLFNISKLDLVDRFSQHPQSLPTCSRVWLAFPTLCTELSSPGAGLPFHQRFFPIKTRHFGSPPLSFLYLWPPGLLSPPFPSGPAQPGHVLWTLPDIPASDYALTHIYNKLPPPPHLGAVMTFLSFLFLFSFT